MSDTRVPLRLGTRRSALASTQSEWVAQRLRAAGHPVELVAIVTEGDQSQAPLTSLGGAGVFVGAIRRALGAGEIDLAVHSLKDLPTATPAGEPDVLLAAVPIREDPRDALVARDGLTLGELPPGARIGTGSPRRASQLLALGLGLVPVPVRGNVPTRLAMVKDGRLDAVVLARAGLNRLGLAERVTQTLDPLQMLPAPGQGALAIECRADADPELLAALGALDDPDTRACVSAERALLAALQAGCSAPIGALAEVVEGEDGLELSLRAVVLSSDGSGELRRSAVGPIHDPLGLGRRLAALLIEDGALDELEADRPPVTAEAT